MNPTQYDYLPIHELLGFFSTEGLLICATCRAWYDQCTCATNFVPLGLIPVERVLRYKVGERLTATAARMSAGEPVAPVRIEGRTLLRGHHRVLAAHLLGKKHLAVEYVTDEVETQVTYHRSLTAVPVPAPQMDGLITTRMIREPALT